MDRDYERYIAELAQSEIDRIKSLSLSSLESELRQATNYGRRRLILQIIRNKRNKMQNK